MNLRLSGPGFENTTNYSKIKAGPLGASLVRALLKWSQDWRSLSVKVRDERVDPCAILIVCCSFFFVCGHIILSGDEKEVFAETIDLFRGWWPLSCSTYSIGIDLGLTWTLHVINFGKSLIDWDWALMKRLCGYQQCLTSVFVNALF